MKIDSIKKPSCIVDFNNEAEIDFALAEVNFNNSKFTSFENSYKMSLKRINSLNIN